MDMKRTTALLLTALLLTLQVALHTAHAVQPAAEPVVTPAFTPLPLGEVEPAGWLRDWAVTMCGGISGHLDERHPVFHDGWKGIPIQWTGANPDGTGWPIEQSAYWLDGALRLGLVLHDEALIRKIAPASTRSWTA